MSVLEQFITNGLRDKSDATVKTYSHGLKQFAEYLEGYDATLETFTRSDVQGYMDYLTAKKKSAAVVHKAYSAIVKFAKWAKRPEVIEEIRVKKSATKPDESKALDPEQQRKLIRDFESGKTNRERNLAILQVLLNTGMRVSELVGLDRDDIVMSERSGKVTIRNGKGFKERIVPLDKEARRAIRKYLETRSDDDPALFMSNEMNRISIRSVQTLFEKYGVNVHQFRHTFVTDLMRTNTDLSTIQAMTGHESVDMILRYSRPTFEDCERAIERKAFRES